MIATKPGYFDSEAKEEISMPWTIEHYPESMKNLPPVVREKAIVIANALLEHGYPEDQSLRIATARAQAWALHMRIGDLGELGL
jgi:uncharacterized protein YdaT